MVLRFDWDIMLLLKSNPQKGFDRQHMCLYCTRFLDPTIQNTPDTVYAVGSANRRNLLKESVGCY